MGKMCAKTALWILIAIVAIPISQTSIGSKVFAQSSDPLLLPRLSFSDISYAGGFRLPAEASNGESFARGGQAVAFNPSRPSLFISSRVGLVAEVSIPSPVISNDVINMPFAQYLQGFADPVEGRIAEVASWGVWTNSLLVQNGRLFGTASMYYDANNDQRVSHFSRSLQLNQPSFQGWTQVWDSGRAGFVSGLLAAVPSEWQQRLGSSMVSGQCCVPIVSRTSWGPAAFSFDPVSIGQAAVPASPLLYYTADHPTLGSWSGSNDTYGSTTEMGGLVIVAGTRTALFFGRNGLGPACYGPGTNDPTLQGKPVPPSGTFVYCYDPTGVDQQGVHAYPYQYQIWAYDLNDFAAVKAGTKNPWDVVPYGVWPFSFPTQEPRVILGGVSYDAAHQTIYIAQSYADPDVYESRPIIHVLKVSGSGSTLEPPQAPPQTPPPTQVTSVSIMSSVAAPQSVGASITFTASPVGGGTPPQFKWMTTVDGVSWSSGTWSTSNQFRWTPSAANSKYQVRVWVRGPTNTADSPEALATIPFPIVDANPAVSSVTLTANKTAPQAVGSAISFTAAATGGNASNQFKWLLFDGATWTVVANWGSVNAFTWTPSSANSQYQIRVWARSGTSTVDQAEALASVSFPIEATSQAPPSRVNNVTLTSNEASPQPLGPAVQWAASASGGSNPLQFKWSVYDGSTWTVVGGWGTASTFNWKPGKTGTYEISVGVRSGGNSADQAEASAKKAFSIIDATDGGSSNGPFKSVTIAADRPSPQTANTAVSWTATIKGGNAPALYKWMVQNGSTSQTVANWSSSPRLTWTPTAPGNYVISVWVKRANNNLDQPEVSATTPFVIK